MTTPRCPRCGGVYYSEAEVYPLTGIRTVCRACGREATAENARPVTPRPACRSCGRTEFKSPASLRAHERQCKRTVAPRTVAGAGITLSPRTIWYD